jgi:hypothetical protein
VQRDPYLETVAAQDAESPFVNPVTIEGHPDDFEGWLTGLAAEQLRVLVMDRGHREDLGRPGATP